MLIFNTTYKVSKDDNRTWLQWIHNQHIPFMLGSGLFSTPQIAKVVGSEDDEGESYSVQFHIPDMDALMHWHRENAEIFRQNCVEKFGTSVVFFSTVLEIVENKNG